MSRICGSESWVGCRYVQVLLVEKCFCAVNNVNVCVTYAMLPVSIELDNDEFDLYPCRFDRILPLYV